ncbi:hypothetical protein ACFQV2_35395 [Actinokineospora soli]|uniref:Uncharacterized protein n=1 Tax=Actinokineospora soli TaxID=1048753 RepID=A0ABW2TYD9_9PSEU
MQAAAAPAADLAAAGGCVQLWNPYKKKIGKSWYVEVGGRLHNCGATYLVVELQQKRWWGWDGRGSKTITVKGDANPRAKCRDFKTTTWRLHAFWYKRLPNGKIERLGQWLSKKPFVTKC